MDLSCQPGVDEAVEASTPHNDHTALKADGAPSLGHPWQVVLIGVDLHLSAVAPVSVEILARTGPGGRHATSPQGWERLLEAPLHTQVSLAR